ncbi:MAG: hypothetical protein C4517_13280 [Stygiobacter sp.]|nr:MAG: hypothetical protein C4517_13280 [Stygiobacter sp.]
MQKLRILFINSLKLAGKIYENEAGFTIYRFLKPKIPQTNIAMRMDVFCIVPKGTLVYLVFYTYRYFIPTGFLAPLGARYL